MLYSTKNATSTFGNGLTLLWPLEPVTVQWTQSDTKVTVPGQTQTQTKTTTQTLAAMCSVVCFHFLLTSFIY